MTVHEIFNAMITGEPVKAHSHKSRRLNKFAVHKVGLTKSTLVDNRNVIHQYHNDYIFTGDFNAKQSS